MPLCNPFPLNGGAEHKDSLLKEYSKSDSMPFLRLLQDSDFCLAGILSLSLAPFDKAIFHVMSCPSKSHMCQGTEGSLCPQYN